ncbi:hypothetical protein T12_2586 [Trichinella patagoniensis]|uniref:Uncharacterized protein n=1 Tax=Trichinella patagoniensis TaxID=990121 RepID=A0A0V0ZD05_9BILA|nr:hypothetical protein T12_2586 [Trichinella patagoniensis]
MIPFKDSNGGVYIPAGRGDALSLVLTELVIMKPSNLEITYSCIGESIELLKILKSGQCFKVKK